MERSASGRRGVEADEARAGEVRPLHSKGTWQIHVILYAKGARHGATAPADALPIEGRREPRARADRTGVTESPIYGRRSTSMPRSRSSC